MSVADKQQQFVDEFSIIPDRLERLSAVISRHSRLPALDSAEKIDHYRVPGCVSRVWVAPSVADGRLELRCAAESPLVGGLVSLLCEIYHGEFLSDVFATEPTVLESLELTRDLSPTRQNGLRAVRAYIRACATPPSSAP
jgi:cysteine desulfuration protein SufE